MNTIPAVNYVMSFLMSPTRSKEQIETILEPFQCILQLALLSYCPQGTKLNMSNNLLEVQLPGYKQSFIRWYQTDRCNDLVHLFNACKRFPIFYKRILEERFYELLVHKAIKGIDNLMNTYSTSRDHNFILQTLFFYKKILMDSLGKEHKSSFSSSSSSSSSSSTPSPPEINDIFIEITKLYSKEEFRLVYDLFKLMDTKPSLYKEYMAGIKEIMYPTFLQIPQWIQTKLV